MSTTTTLATNDIIPRSALRHRPISQPGENKNTTIAITPRASRKQTQDDPKKTLELQKNTTPKAIHRDHSLHWTVPVGITMLTMLLLMWAGQALWSWGTTTYDDILYGRPRTTQVDAFVGHEQGNKPSHFIALNYQGRIEIIEFPGGDAAHARIFFGPQFAGPQADLIPVNLTFSDTRHDHHPDMIVEAQQSQFIFKNQNGTFMAPASP
jgi:hypothetical protein